MSVRTLLVTTAIGTVLGTALGLAALPAFAAGDSLVIGQILEPVGLDPTIRSEAAIAQITLYNIYEGLTRIDETGAAGAGLATSWTIAPDFKTVTLKLRPGVKFADGTVFDSADVKFAFERNAADGSTNKRRGYFTNMASIATPDPLTVVIALKQANPQFLFNMGEEVSVIVAAETAATNADSPVGTGPYKVERWVKGDSVVLGRNAGYRDPAAAKLNRVTFKFINDASAQVAAVLAGDVEYFPFFGSPESLAVFERDPRFEIVTGSTEGETVLAINNKRGPLGDRRVRQAISHALDRKEIIQGAQAGYGVPIGSHFAPHHAAYVDLTGIYPHDPVKARQLLGEAGYPEGLTLSLKLPPPPYARKSGEIIAAQLAKVGIMARIEQVEFAQWLEGTFTQKNYDLSIIAHVEPMDIGVYANPGYYFQYDNSAFRTWMEKADSAVSPAERNRYLQEAQRLLAYDAVNGFLFQLPKITVQRKGLKGTWKNAPLFVNDLAAMSWN